MSEQNGFFILASLDWCAETQFGYCPFCNSEMVSVNRTAKNFGLSKDGASRIASKIVTCKNSIPQTAFKSMKDKEIKIEAVFTEAHFFQRFEEEIVGIDRKELRRWDTRTYRRGLLGYEICYRTYQYAPDSTDERHSNDTIVTRWKIGNPSETVALIFSGIANFNQTPEKLFKKVDRLFILE